MNYPQSAQNRKGVNLRLTLLEDKIETIIQKAYGYQVCTSYKKKNNFKQCEVKKYNGRPEQEWF